MPQISSDQTGHAITVTFGVGGYYSNSLSSLWNIDSDIHSLKLYLAVPYQGNVIIVTKFWKPTIYAQVICWLYDSNLQGSDVKASINNTCDRA